MKYKFDVEVEINAKEKKNFLYAFENRKFDFFRYLADNDAKITMKEV